MKKISTQDISDGMELAQDLAGPNGNVILPKGVKLKIALISRLVTWGIDEVFIVSQESSANALNEDTKEDYVNQLKPLFIDGIELPLNGLLYRTLVQLHEGSPQ